MLHRKTMTRMVSLVITGLIAVISAEPAISQTGKSSKIAKQDSVTSSSASGGVLQRTFQIEGMTCMACVARVKKTLFALEGVKDVEVSLEKRSATVQVRNERVTTATLVSAVSDLGYKAAEPRP